MSKMIFCYEPTPRQMTFHRIYSRHKLYGGAAGGGKTDALLGELLLNCIKYKGIKQLFIRKTNAQVQEIIDERLPKMIHAKEKPYHISKGVLHFNGSIIVLGYWQDDRRNDRYFSSEYDVIAVDELTRTIYSKQELQKLLIRNRTTKKELVDIGFKPYFMAGTNPGGRGHSYVKDARIDCKPWSGYDSSDFAFVPAKLDDNKYITMYDPDYEMRLLSIEDENLRKAMRFGDRDVFDGQYFTEWMREEIVIDPYFPICKRYVMGGDYGYTNPSCILWMGIDNDDNVIVYKELYQTQLLYGTLSEMVKSMMGPEEIYLAMDPAALNKKSESTGKTLGDYLGEKQIRAVTANNARLDGRNLLKTLIHRGKLKICSNCVNLIRTMPMMIHAKVNVEDMDSSGEDHAVDALRYGVMEIIGQKGVANPQEILKNTSKDEDDFSFSQKR